MANHPDIEKLWFCHLNLKLQPAPTSKPTEISLPEVRASQYITNKQAVSHDELVTTFISVITA